MRVLTCRGATWLRSNQVCASAEAVRHTKHEGNAVRISVPTVKEDVVKSLLAGLRYEQTKGLSNTQVNTHTHITPLIKCMNAWATSRSKHPRTLTCECMSTSPRYPILACHLRFQDQSYSERRGALAPCMVARLPS